jgi:hypothetical protein
MERIINADVIDYLHTNRIIIKSRHGFLLRHSICTNLLESVHDFPVAMNNKCPVDVMYIEFKKAFDTVSHPKLTLKLKAMEYQVIY